MPLSIVDKVYPEKQVFGFTREDGTIHFLSRVHALLRPDSIVLDVGCGRGQSEEDPCAARRAIRRLRGERRRIIGIDVDLQAAGNPLLDEFRHIDQKSHWPVSDAEVDLIYSDYVLEHVENPRAFFQEAARVLRPGGYVCMRTPNFLGYAAFLTWLVPNHMHRRVLRHVQPGRKSVDVFPTWFRCNTAWRASRVLKGVGMEPFVYSIEGEPGYLEPFPILYRLAASIVPHFPSMFKSTLLVFARKPLDA